VLPGAAATWYTGTPLLRYLEEVPVHVEEQAAPFRMAVQWVNRPNSDFRGFSGLIASGRIAPGDAVVIAPSGRTSTIARIYTADGDLPHAVEGQSVTLVLTDEVDASRGSVIAPVSAPIRVTDTLDARLFWAAETELSQGATLLAKIGTVTVNAVVTTIRSRIDPETGQAEPVTRLVANDIGDVVLTLDRAVPVDAYAANRDTGGFILIDRETTDTAALGLVQAPASAPKPATVNAAETSIDAAESAKSGGLLAGIKRLFGG
jgi:sulfate adenylyltransferase subunit 1